MKVRIEKIEYYLPPTIEDNGALQASNPDWRMDDIVKKTGVLQRRLSAPNQTALDMGVLAAEKVFATGVDPKSLDFLIFITQSPDYRIPTSACILQHRLGLPTTCQAFDVNLGCSGFVYGISMAASLIESGLAKKGMIICSETYTRYIAPTDRTCRPLFSDGAAAAVISKSSKDEIGPFDFGTDGSGYEDLILKASGARADGENAVSHSLFMNGAKVFMFTMDAVPKTIAAVLKKAGVQPEDVDHFIFHQASKYVMENIIRKADLPESKVFLNYSTIGNTVSASLPMALKDAFTQNKIKEGDLIMLVAYGVGYSWGSCLMRAGGAL